MRQVRVIENSRIARLAARKMGYAHIAIVFGHTIYLHNTPAGHFLASRRWVFHELKHVEQYERYGTAGFLVRYLWEYFRNGYYQNKFEIEAREAEHDEALLLKYKLLTNVR